MVDDELDITFTIKTVLEATGLFEVKTFNDPRKALSGFNSNQYDLAILDIKMPQMDGFDLCRRLMKEDNRIKICFLTAAELSYYEELASDIINIIGRDCFIFKPINIEDLVSKLKSMLTENE
jgi:DNA-binding response OmpR family regulator